jgi:hypothetical protein
MYNKIYGKTVRRAKKLYYDKQFEANKKDSKKTWELTNELLGRKIKSELSNSFIVNGSLTDDKKTIASKFNEFFVNVGPSLANKFSKSTNYKQYLGKPVKATHKFSAVKEKVIVDIIKGMEAKKSSGHDQISNWLLKQIVQEIKTPLTQYINASIMKGIVPSYVTKAKVVPLYKAGDKTEFTNYRPISLLPTISKVLEKVVDKQIRAYLKENSILYERQYGFRAGHETQHALLKLLDEVEGSKYSITIFADLKKAFDTVDHKILLQKLSHYGINSSWFESYLTNRLQITEFKGVKSDEDKITMGVPQGSILGPLLFIIYINDLPNASKLLTILFADDTTLQAGGNNIKELLTDMERELDKVADWFTNNKLSLHPGKTFYMVFGEPGELKVNLKGTPLQRVGESEDIKTIKFLGIYLDDKLQWHRHIDHVYKKVRKSTTQLAKVKEFCTSSVRNNIYNSLIKSYLEYGITLWGGARKKWLAKLITCQKLAIKHVLNRVSWNHHSTPAFKLNKQLIFSDLYKLNVVKLGFQCRNKLVSPSVYNLFTTRIHNVQTRASYEHTFNVNRNRKFSIFQNLPILWNGLDWSLKESLTLKQLKRLIKTNYINEYDGNLLCGRQGCFTCKS